jgi:hypothetical protein
MKRIDELYRQIRLSLSRPRAETDGSRLTRRLPPFTVGDPNRCRQREHNIAMKHAILSPKEITRVIYNFSNCLSFHYEF